MEELDKTQEEVLVPETRGISINTKDLIESDIAVEK